MRHIIKCLIRAIGMILLLCGGAQAQDSGAAGPLEEIIVTAQRREERLTDVPISVSVFNQDRLDAQQIRSIDDIARLTPGVTFSRGDARNAGASSIAIRGIASTVAASTTGIYIDDTPIQTRIIGAGASNFNTYPAVFDLERVEVLRGPQGTLFGSGSEGGTLRFITPRPDLERYSAYARAEYGFIEHGGKNYEGGIAAGGPLVEGKLGFRLSGWIRRDGGYIDRVNTDPKPGDVPFATLNAPVGFPPAPDTDAPTVLPLRNRINYVAEENANHQESRVIKGALAFVPREDLEITASVYYQNINYNDTNAFWEGLSDTDEGRYRQGWPLRQPSSDEFWLPALAINWDLGPVRLSSSTSYLDRHQQALNDYTVFESALWAGFWEFPVGMFAPTTQINDHRGWTQELRVESTDADSRLQWVAGIFYQANRQQSQQFVENTFLPDLYQDSTGCNFTDPPPPLSAFVPFPCNFPASPFGPGPHGFGQPLVNGLYTFNQDPVIAHDEQFAGFFQADFAILEQLTLTVGARYADTSFDASAHYNGPVVGPPVSDSGEQQEDPLTPKFGLTYKPSPENMFYATAAQGFRVGGYNPQIGLPCVQQLATLGYFPTAGNPTGRPTTFESDTLWSYEIGTKNTLFGGRAQLNASAYYIDWDNIQQGVGIGSCGFGFTINAGKAVSQGFDLEASFQATENLSLATAVGFNDAEFKETVLGGPSATVPQISAGDKIPGSPWAVTASGQYDFVILETPGFIRLDYEFHSEGPEDTAGLNLANRSPVLPPPDPATFIPAPETHFLTLRAGTQIGSVNVTAFIRNLTNENPNLGRGDLSFRPVPYGPDAHNYTGQTLVPRTVGATITYRY